jgi:hypothetical protein
MKNLRLSLSKQMIAALGMAATPQMRLNMPVRKSKNMTAVHEPEGARAKRKRKNKLQRKARRRGRNQ